MGRLGTLKPESRRDRRDVRAMTRVIQRGASRTKEIVKALHNYFAREKIGLVEGDHDTSASDER